MNVWKCGRKILLITGAICIAGFLIATMLWLVVWMLSVRSVSGAR
ncbi:MAG: hypothetical protein A4E35_00844 [Methanoregula sp. PtaU1.Bin051]|nr:MAG: hypothetical protein A4E35_00844 [Methanoregula sp. PtaU1.Bin051]